ncbi:asparagine synthase (glutamine-hydrolyzing) [Alsobacter sp. SYSU BS001988]|jgi:asparagine synthase (glutamine-hydrolysing)
MCGFAGLVQRDPSRSVSERFAALALKSLGRRGPDDARALSVGPVDFVHTRLSIIDHEGGVQPMQDDAGVIAYNGEIYNFEELRQPNLPYATRSDTEVLLKGLNTQGTSFLNGADGMFGFAYLNKAQQKLYVARDRYGVKPAYVLHTPEVFAFGSTMQALMPFSAKRIDRKAYVEYYTSRAAHAPRTLFEDVREVPPGWMAIFDLRSFTMEMRRWADARPRPVTRRPEGELLDELDGILHASVRAHLVADTPVASLLSGGIDSGLVTAIAAKYVPDLACFSAGFQDRRFDESPYAQAVARRYGLRHYVKFMSEETVFGLLDSWPSVMDDANAEPASVLKYVVAQFARDSGFKVVLAGEGADEFFGGYNQYWRFRLARRLSALGAHAPGLAEFAARAVGPRTRVAHFLRQASGRQGYPGTSMPFEPHLVREMFAGAEPEDFGVASLKGALFLDQSRRLPDDMLTAADRATMHASIEARVPFVTRSVADFAASLEDDMLLRGRQQKYLLRQLARRYLPAECVDRPKVGFDLPLGRWFRGRLRDVVYDTLADTWQREFLRPGAMERIVDLHMSGRADFADKIWAFVVLDRNVRAMRAIA